MKIDNSNSQMLFNNYKDLHKYVIYVNPKQYVRMMRRRLERDRFLDRKGRPKKIYVPIAIREVSKRVIQHDDLINDPTKIKKIPSKRETPKNYEGLMNNPNCNNINIYINNPINNSNTNNNTANNNNINSNNNFNMNNNMSNWPCFYWNMSGYYNMNSSIYSSLYPNQIGSDGISGYHNTGNNNSGISVTPLKNIDYNNYYQTSNMIYPNNQYYYNSNSNNQSNNTNNNGISNNNINSSNINISNYGIPNNNNNNNKSIKNEEFTNLVQGVGYNKGYDGLMGNQGFSSTTSTSSSFYNINSPSNMNNMYITNNFDNSSFSSTAMALTNPGSIIESHSSMSTSSGFNGPLTERDNKTNNTNNNSISNNINNNNKREEIMNNYINLNNSPFSECSIDTEVVCKTEQIYNINQNGTVIDTNIGDEISIGLNEPMFFNSNLISNIDENVIGNIIDSNCVATSCYLETGTDGTYNETHLQSILMDQNSINTTSTIINDNDMIFNTANSTTNNSINTSGSIHSIHSFEDRIQGENREQVGISTRQCDSNDSSYIYRQLCDYF